jgi:serine/threonine protein kinase/tetratricopeptide (TPR) repeat protein
MTAVVGGRYQIEAQIGVGGMGTVFRGIDQHTHQPVAIKQLKPDLNQPEVIERFKREGEALRQLNHPNIVKILDAVEQDGQRYLIIEYMPGGDLRHLLKEKPLPVVRILQIALDLADALTRAHRLNIIHRDLKPANVLIAEDGTPRLTDFGIAHMGQKERVTEAGSILGTVDYVAPEVLLGHELDARADIWAFGVMLFEMVAGRRPFEGSTITAVMTNILTTPTPDLEALRPDCAVAFADLIYRMLEKDRNARIPSIRLVGAELETILQGRDSSSWGIKPRQVSPLQPAFATPTPPTDAPKHNLRAQTTPFVGREHELAEMVKLLDNPALRLVTILAPGGMGKTRLALEVGGKMLNSSSDPLHGKETNSYSNGVYFVSLAPLTTAENIVPAVAEAVGFQFYPGGDPRQQLLDFFREKRMLLIMDNFEHVLDSVNIVNDILQAASGVKIIATSRQRLNLSGETVFNLGSMDFPDWETPENALEYSAVKLFMQSAKRVRPDFELKTDDVNYLARICRVVQGMPLGILLAAAWVGALSLKEITEEIGMSLDFLETEMHDIPTRQRSIRAVFDYSWTLLDENERIVFSKLSVFHGGFTREAAQAVAHASLRQLTTLVNKSLLRRDPDSGRFEIHELLRQYGDEQLEKSGEAGAVRDAHSAYFADFMRLREVDLKGKRQRDAGQEIETDFDNIRQAWHYTVSQAQIERLGQFLYSLNLVAYQHKQYSELVGMFADAVETLQPTFGEHRNYGRLLVLYGQCLEGLGQLENAENQLRRALAIAQAEKDVFGIAQVSLWLARVIDPSVSKREEARELCEKSILIFRELGDDYELANALHYQGYLLWVEQKHRESLELNRQVLEVRRRLGDDIGAATSLYNMVGSLYFTNPIEAETQCREVLALYKRLNQPFGVAVSVCRLAAIELYKGDLEIARLHGEDSLRIGREIGAAFIISDALVQLAWIDIASDRFPEAEERINQDINTEDDGVLAEHALLQCFIHLGLQDWTAAKRQLVAYLQLAKASREPISILGMGLIAAAEGQPERGLELASRAMTEATTTSFRMKMPLVERYLRAIKDGLTVEVYNAAWERGKARDMEAAVHELLAEENP